LRVFYCPQFPEIPAMPTHAEHTSVDDGFDSLGYAYAEPKVTAGETAIHGVRDLWCAVIAQAFVDIGVIAPAASNRKSREPLRARGRDYDEAVRWLLRDKSDFPYICDLAGVSPRIIRRAAQVFYGRRQLALGALVQEKEGAS
jgi:hypothetical protein